MPADNLKLVPGRNAGDIILYALSTCHWCRQTKKLLGELGVQYRYVDVDSLVGEDKDRTREDVTRWNPACSFPTIVINKKCIVGFDEEKIRKALK